MGTIISVTERAVEHLKDLLDTRAESPNQCLRLVIAAAGQTGLVLDNICEEDHIIEANGAPVLLVAPVLAPIVEGATLDYAETSEGSWLTLSK